MAVNWDLVANVSTNRMEVNGDINANISSTNRVEVYEDQDVTLTFVMEAYPPLTSQGWMTSSHINNNNVVYQQSYTASGCRLAC